MAITFQLTHEIEVNLERELGSLSDAAREAFLIESYRRGRLSLGDIASVLGFETHFESERWLGERGVAMNYSLEDLQADRETLNGLLGSTPT